MAIDTPRMAELRRRVRMDPASIAFAQLAEEFRRAGAMDEAVRTCREGLAHHPDYLSAHVTLGRALLELGRLDEAAAEFDAVRRVAPDNLAAVRGLAEIHQRRAEAAPAAASGLLAALDDALDGQTSAVPPEPAVPFDFDALLDSLGSPTGPPSVEQWLGVPLDSSLGARVNEPSRPGSSLGADPDQTTGDDAFAALEQRLRDAGSTALTGDDRGALAELERWLAALVADRRHPSSR